MDKQQGFSVVSVVLLLIVAGLIGFTGWFVWKSNKVTNVSLERASTTTEAAVNQQSGASTTTTAQKDTQRYLTIKEWGVKIPLSSTIDSAVYSSGQYSTGTVAATSGSVKLGLLSLGGDCDNSSKAPLGNYVEFTQGDVDKEVIGQVPEGVVSLHELAKTAVEVPGSDGGYGGYYIAYVAPASSCSEDSAAFNTAVLAFQQAFKNVKADE